MEDIEASIEAASEAGWVMPVKGIAHATAALGVAEAGSEARVGSKADLC
jgi:hypothetical protein